MAAKPIRSIKGIVVKAMKELSIDYKVVADLAQIPRPTIWRYLNTPMDLTGARLELILEALDVRLIRYLRPESRQHRQIWREAMRKTLKRRGRKRRTTSDSIFD